MKEESLNDDVKCAGLLVWFVLMICLCLLRISRGSAYYSRHSYHWWCTSSKSTYINAKHTTRHQAETSDEIPTNTVFAGFMVQHDQSNSLRQLCLFVF